MRRRELMRRSSGVLSVAAGISIAGCAGDDGSDNGGDDGETEAAEEEEGKSLTFNLSGGRDYQTLSLTVESLTFKAASTEDESATIDIGETVDLTEASGMNGVTVSEDLTVPYGSYQGVEITVSVNEVVDSQGSSVSVSGGTLSRSLLGVNDEPATVEESMIDASLTLFISVTNGELRLSGYSATGL